MDLVAHTRLKTPTAVSEFLISGLSRFDNYLNELKNRFVESIEDILVSAKSDVEQYSRSIIPLVREKITKGNSQLNQTIWKFDNHVKIFIQNQTYQLTRTEESLRHEFKNFSQLQLRYLEKTTRALSATLQVIKLDYNELLQRKIQRTEKLVKNILSERIHYLELTSQKAMLTDPTRILARGYSITTYNGRALKDTDRITSKDHIETRLYKGNVISEVITILK